MVTCLCLTCNRREWLPRAIACFLDQTYEPRELLIVADGEDSISDLVPNGERIRLVYLAGRRPIGEKRNFGCAHARGDIIAHWDDDDYSAPGRLADQVDRLSNSGKSVTNYRNLRFTDGTHQWMNTNWPGGYGTSLAYQRAWWQKHLFLGVQIDEDWEFVCEAMRHSEFVVGDAQEFMLATIHPNNTSPRVIGVGWIPTLAVPGHSGL